MTRIPSGERGPWHPGGAELFEYVTEGVSSKNLHVERHLLAGCARCEELLACMQVMEDGRRAYLDFDARFQGLLGEGASPEQREAFYAPLRGGDRPLERLARLSFDGMELAERIVTALSESTEAARRAIAGMENDLARGLAYVYACQMAIQGVPKDPARSLSLSELLAQAAQGLPYARRKGRRQPVSCEQLHGETGLLAAHALTWLDRPKEAREAATLSRASFAQAGEDSFALALCDYYEGSAATFSGELGEAMALLKRALMGFTAYAQGNWSARADAALGVVLSRKGRERHALWHYERALSGLSLEEDAAPHAATLFNSAFSLVRLGRLSEAKTRYARALLLVRRHSLSHMLYPIRHGLATVELRKGNHERALSLFEALAHDARAAGLNERYLTAELHVAECLGRVGREGEMRERIDALRTLAGPSAASGSLLDLFSQLDAGELTAGHVAHVAAYVEEVARGAVATYRPLRLLAQG